MRLCDKCQTRPGTEKFGDSGSMVARGYFSMWCRRCVLVAQIDYAEKAVARLDKLRAELESLDRIASTTDGSAVLQEEPPSPSVEAHPEPRKDART